MDKKYLLFSFFFLICFASKCSSTREIQNRRGNGREGKVFSLFTIVNFDNDGCESTSTLTSGGKRNGTCFTSSECGDKGGTAKGNCASGFGVCCIFILNDSTKTTVSYNNTYLQNPGNPASYTETNALSYTVNKCSPDVCFIRLDFEDFTINGPANSCEYDGCTDATPPTFDEGLASGGKCATDTLVVSSAQQTAPTICGKNTGQHIYIAMGPGDTDSANVALGFQGTDGSQSRKWDVKVSQIPCGNYAPPDGCLQYYTGVSGQIMTFNFLDTATTHLASQNYNVCMRKEQGYCCNKYTVCDSSTYTQPFSLWLDVTANVDKNLVDTSCTEDYISIDGAQGMCSIISGNSRQRFCGGSLNAGAGNAYTVSAPVCDCSAPFTVGIVTDATADKQDTNIGATMAKISRGLCLDYQQQPC